LADVRHIGANAIDRIEIRAVGAHHRRATVSDQVAKIIRDESVIRGDQHRPEHRDGVVRLEMGVGIRRDIDDAVARPDAGRLKVRCPTLASGEELLVGEADVAVHDGLA
jgi:hypothetical protein